MKGDSTSLTRQSSRWRKKRQNHYQQLDNQNSLPTVGAELPCLHERKTYHGRKTHFEVWTEKRIPCFRWRNRDEEEYKNCQGKRLPLTVRV